jgi:hypothetical protein
LPQLTITTPLLAALLWQKRLPGNWLGERSMLWTIIVILFILWLLGFSFHVGGSLIHLLLVIAVIVLIFNLITGRRGV